jgi:5-aminopentanamidase
MAPCEWRTTGYPAWQVVRIPVWWYNVLMVRAAFYQFNPVFGRKGENLGKVHAAVMGAEAEFLVLPELFATGYQFISTDEVRGLSEPIPEGETTRFLVGLSRDKDMYIVGGLAELDGDRIFNSAVLTGPQGFIGSYRKTHLFYEEKLFFTPGDSGFRVFETALGRIGIMICFDWLFPESMRTLALMGAEVVAHPANLVLPYCPQAMPIRCLENRLYAVTANRIGREERKTGESLTFIGRSQITGPDASVCCRAPDDEEALMTCHVDLEKVRDKTLNRFNDILLDRRPEMYRMH